MHPRVLSVPRVGQFIRSGRYTLVGTLGETSNAMCWMTVPPKPSTCQQMFYRTESTQHTLKHNLVIHELDRVKHNFISVARTPLPSRRMNA